MTLRGKKNSAARALGLMAVGVILISFLFQPADLPCVEICQFKKLTGLPCPGCGLTRGFCAISHGDFGRAWSFNPFSFLFYTAAVLLIVALAVSHFRPRPMDRILGSSAMPYAVITGALIMTAWGIWRMIGVGHIL